MTSKDNKLLINKINEMKLNESTLSASNGSAHKSVTLDSVLNNKLGRKLFGNFLKESRNKSAEDALIVYLFCSCSCNQDYDDPERIKTMLTNVYNICVVKSSHKLGFLPHPLRLKLIDVLKNTRYDEDVINSVKNELRAVIEFDYYPKFIKSKMFKEYLSSFVNKPKTENKMGIDEFLDPYKENQASSNEEKLSKPTSASYFAMPTIPKSTASSTSFCSSSTSSNNKLKHSKSSTSASSCASSISNASTQSKKSSSKPSVVLSNNSKQLNYKCPSSNDLVCGGGSSGKAKKSKGLAQFPPNPYHVASSILPVSLRDSELQSVVSGDIQFEDFRHRKAENSR